MPSRLRPRTISELVDVEFELLRRHYLSLLTIVAAGFAPAAALGGIEALTGAFASGTGAQAAGVSSMAVAWIALGLVLVACFLLVQGALIHAASDAYLDDRVDVADAFRRAATQLPTTLGAYLLAGIIVILGYLCLFFPGIWLYAGLFAVPAVALLENRGPDEAVGRSFALTKGRKLPVLGALFLIGIIAAVSRTMISIVGAVTNSVGVSLATQIAAYILAYPLGTVMVVLLYYDARIRFEGFDIERAAAALGTETAA